MHFDYTAWLDEYQIFFTAKMKLIHVQYVNAIELASSDFDVLAVICQLLLAQANRVKTSPFCCYA